MTNDQNDILDTSPEDKSLERKITNNAILSMKDSALELHEELLKPLILSVERMKTEVNYASTSFDSTTQEAITSLLSVKQLIAGVIDRIYAPLEALSKNSDSLQSTAKLLSIIPNKIDDRLAKLPQNFTQVLASSIPGIAKELNSAIKQPIEQLMGQLTEFNKSIVNETKKSIAELVISFKAETGKISQQLKNDIVSYQIELEKILEKSGKNRMRRLFLILVISGAFSAIISGLTSWVVNSHFPRSVEITGTQHLVVKDSQVLVTGSETYKVDKQKESVK